MHCNSKLSTIIVFVPVCILTLSVGVGAQSSVSNGQSPASITILDSTKAQDGLNGAVRRVKTESAKLELKGGRLVQGPLQLVEVTTYGLNGNRIENISYPVGNSSAGKEEYKYDKSGNIVEMTMRSEDGSILGKETYDYEFDRFGNWTKMVTSLVVFESGELKHEPVEITFRTLTYYFDESIAKIVDAPSGPKMPVIPDATGSRVGNIETVENGPNQIKSSNESSPPAVVISDPPPAPDAAKRLEPTRNEVESGPNYSSVWGARRESTSVTSRSTSNPSLTGSETGKEEKTAPRPDSAEKTSVQPTAAPSSTSGNVDSVREKAPGDTVLTNTVTSNARIAFEHYKTGLQLFEAGDLKGAVQAYLKSIEIEPKSAEVQLRLGHAYIKLQKDKEAVKAFAESVHLNPELPEAQYGLGLASFRVGRNKEAADAFKRAVALRPEMAKAHYGLALAYQELGKVDRLIEEYRILETLDRSLAKQLSLAFREFNLPCRVPPYCK